MLVTKVKGALAAATLAGALLVAGPVGAAASGNYTCSGGTIAAGTYSSITVTGFCSPGKGTVTVLKSLTIASGGGLDSANASSTVIIGGSLDVKKGGFLALGCGPDPDPESRCPEGPAAQSHDTIHGNLDSEGGTLLIIHYDTIGGNVGVHGGGGGLSCDGFPFIDFDHNSIGGNASETDLRTCWSGFSNNEIGGNVDYTNNQTGIPDGNFVGGNSIGGNLSCSADSPTPHLSDSPFPPPNSVAGHTSGQCVAEV